MSGIYVVASRMDVVRQSYGCKHRMDVNRVSAGCHYVWYTRCRPINAFIVWWSCHAVGAFIIYPFSLFGEVIQPEELVPQFLRQPLVQFSLGKRTQYG